MVGSNAAVAASGAAKSQADIPVIGPGLAAAAFAATLAMVLAARNSIKSAAGGYDIPAGTNPLTQLHENEMVLPAHIAQPLRQNLANGGGVGGPQLHINVSAMDAASVVKALEKDGALHKALGNAARRFAYP